MSKEQWSAVDRYLTDLVVGADAALDATLESSAANNLPAINVSPVQGKFLHLIAKIHGARKILEIGTLAGYSAIWMARALPEDGRLITLEYDPKHADVARANIQRAGLSGKVELMLGSALDTLPKLQADNRGPFDLIFIDADKPNTPNYFEWALKLSRPGGLILVDNVVREGKIIDQSNTDPGIVGTRRFLEALSREKRVTATALQMVGGKGYDGLVIARVNSD